MLGIKPERQREMMDESLGVIMRLFTETDPITYKSDWFELNEAVLQLRPYQSPHIPVAVASVESPSGVSLAGKHGAAVLSLSVPRDTVRKTSLKELWSIAEETAAEHNKVVRREDWGIVMGCHLAETRAQAFEDIREGSARVVTEYFGETLGNPTPDVPRNQIVDYMVGPQSMDRRHSRRLHCRYRAPSGDERRLRQLHGAGRGLGAAGDYPP